MGHNREAEHGGGPHGRWRRGGAGSRCGGASPRRAALHAAVRAVPEGAGAGAAPGRLIRRSFGGRTSPVLRARCSGGSVAAGSRSRFSVPRSAVPGLAVPASAAVVECRLLGSTAG
ncbi:hypothetical protein ACFPRL_18805 [Pseudoclavibacter helvolus]